MCARLCGGFLETLSTNISVKIPYVNRYVAFAVLYNGIWSKQKLAFPLKFYSQPGEFLRPYPSPKYMKGKECQT